VLAFALTLAVAGVDPRVDSAVAAIAEKDCPKLHGMLTESFQKAAPAATWPVWCRSVGALSQLEPLDSKDGWLRFRAQSLKGPTRFDIAFDTAGKISGVRAMADDPQNLDDKLLEIRNRHHLPALAALVQRSGESVMLSAVGVRKAGDATPVRVTDKWHLGSDTKAMTATLAAMLVDEKKLKWSTTLAEVFPEWKDLHSAYAKATLELLLSHRAGLPQNVPADAWKQSSERKDAAHAVLKLAPANASGVFAYSNAGYVVVGAMIERVTGLTWEVAIKKRVFEPLEMSSCGFGPPATPGKVDQPWAHRPEKDVLVPVAPGPESDNPPGIGPAGTVHCALNDWAKFAELHLRGERGEKTGLVSPESMTKLHTAPTDGKYALGWGVIDRPWAGGKTLSHNGSNTMFYATIWIAPVKNLIFLVATNAGDDAAEKAVTEVIGYLVARYGTN
jgi:CubicO group peptidase (beta-lactamase class C family)